ncbi:TM2 domain-containing membrane protein YozV [Rhizomicrobium palustre]|uniref:TM2 domain-containing membrane protein YozV n=1 Tax=Rhizomicrobium palustre TaxID=189966 RepID=A0A846N278_9PROT|nr:hypothetical protein [Rhizomicrobium palustre]NIK89609.1 TM2 domain-containing membrane protein YozV [Rhizomicrobium palustre]
MSEDHTEVKAESHHDHPDIEVERIETVSSTTTPWTVRLIFGVLGLVFIGAAVAAWEFRTLFDSHIAEALPYIIIGLGVLGVGAIVESITTEIWLALIIGAFALVITFLIVGRSQIIQSGDAVFVVDRFTSGVQFCTQDGCKPLPQVKDLPKPPSPVLVEGPLPPPPAAVPAPVVVEPAPAPAPVPAPAPAKVPAKK